MGNQFFFFINNQVEYILCLLLNFQARNLITFLVVAQVISLVAVHKLLWVLIPVLCQVLHYPYLLQFFEVINPVPIQAFILYRLQLIFQVWFHLFKLATFPTYALSLYFISRPRDEPSRLPILHTSLNPSVSLLHTLYEPSSVHLSTTHSRHASTPP